MKKLILTVFLLAMASFGASFDFNQEGDYDAGIILRDFILSDGRPWNFDTVAYFADADNDGKNEVIGIVKSAPFYSISGYQLFILKEKDGVWQNVKSDIYFDNYKNLTVEGKKIKYHKTNFHAKGTYCAKYKNGEFKTGAKPKDFLASKKVKAIENIVIPQANNLGQTMDISDFKANPQPSFYIDLK